jgi:hypothetical protein
MTADVSMRSGAGTISGAPAEPDRLAIEVAADARLCEVALGEPLAAFVVSAESVGQYRRWLSGGEDELRSIAPRLAAARRVILVFEAENDSGLAAAWLREVGAAAEVPARMIRHKGDDESVGTHLAEAAVKWLSRRRSAAAVPA